MKRWVSVIIVWMLFAAFPALALSEGSLHVIEEYDISLEIPEGYRLITPDISPSDPILALYGITAEDVREMFELMPLYMEAVRTDGGGEITVTIQDSDLPDYAEMGQSLLEMMGDEVSALSVQMGINVTHFDIYSHAQMPFVRSYFESDLLEDSGVQYYTVWGGKSYSFALHTYAPAMSDGDGETMERMMENMRFNSFEAKVEKEKSASFVYTDDENGLSFTVPAGWSKHEMDADYGGVHYAVFAADDDAVANIVYTADDLWDDYSGLAKLFYTRAAMDNSALSKSEVADMFGASYSDVDFVTLNGVEYYRAEFSQRETQNGITLTMNTTALLRNYNGSAYLFLYTGSRNSGLMQDFEAMVASAVYPEAAKGVAPILIILPVAAVIAALIIVFSARARKKKRAQQEAEAARIRSQREQEEKIRREEAAERQRIEQMKYISCPKCGNTVLRTSKFCGRCGEKINDDSTQE